MFQHHLDAVGVSSALPIVVALTRQFLLEKSTPQTREVSATCIHLAFRLHDLTIDDLAKPGMVFQIGVEPSRIDILTAISGVSFDHAWANRLSVELDGIELCDIDH